ncbi:ABZJ_00895 family protein [Mesorhizobium sp. M1329]|uniref:ABZJ_00895 family protein n=1 Tax=Mesorhizobium sp. M1329 TaxID=2957083 RepID=UPI00333BCBFE
MNIDRVKSVNIWPYVGYYILTTIVVTIAFAVLFALVPSPPEGLAKASGYAINIAATMFTYSKFIRNNVRLFNRNEYWKIVSFSTLAACLIAAVQILITFGSRGGGQENYGSIPPVAWIGILLFASILVFVLNIAGYSNRFGNTMLKAELARRTRIDAETFR